MTDNLQTSFETAVLAGGCFWCLEAVFVEVRGVIRVESGYTGGHLADPSYDAVCQGDTGHAEVVRLTYDPSLISFQDLLEIFFVIHDPTQRDRQGNDIGSQYRSAIFWTTDAQRLEAVAFVDELRRSRAYLAPVVTEVKQASVFYPAEALHQNYYPRYPQMSYCVRVIEPKLEKFRRTFPDLSRTEA